MDTVASAAAVEFDKTLQELGAEDLTPAAGRRAALAAAASRVWESHLGLLYSSREVMDLMDVTRQAVNERVKRGTLLALSQKGGEYRYPAFQFDATGRPRKAIIDALSEFPEDIADRHTVASWFVSPQPLLNQNTPVEWVDAKGSSETLLEAARRVAARLKQ